MFLRLTVLLFFALPAVLSAQKTTLTITNSVEMALHNNLTVRQYVQNVKIAQDQYNQSLAALAIPSVTASAGSSWENENNLYGINENLNNNSVGLSASKSYPLGGSQLSSLALQQLVLDQQKEKLENEKVVVTASTASNFYMVLMNRDKIGVQNDFVNYLMTNYYSVQTNYNVGQNSLYDLLTAEVTWKTQIPILVQFTNTYRESKLAFLQSIGLDKADPEDYEVIGDFDLATNIVYPVMPESNAFELACSNDISLYGINVQIGTAKLDRDIAFSGQLPVVTGSIGYNGSYATTTTNTISSTTYQPVWTASLSISEPLDSLLPFSGPAQAIAQYNDTLVMLDQSRQQYLDGLFVSVKTLMDVIDVDGKTLDIQKDTIKQNTLNVDEAKTKYAAGIDSAQDVANAEVSLDDARLNYLQAIYNYYSGIVTYNGMIGKLSY